MLNRAPSRVSDAELWFNKDSKANFSEKREFYSQRVLEKLHGIPRGATGLWAELSSKIRVHGFIRVCGWLECLWGSLAKGILVIQTKKNRVLVGPTGDLI